LYKASRVSVSEEICVFIAHNHNCNKNHKELKLDVDPIFWKNWYKKFGTSE